MRLLGDVLASPQRNSATGDVDELATREQRRHEASRCIARTSLKWALPRGFRLVLLGAGRAIGVACRPKTFACDAGIVARGDDFVLVSVGRAVLESSPPMIAWRNA